MNIRKNIDYSSMFEAMDAVITAHIPQMELYRELGRLICARPEKGAAVAAAEYLKNRYQDASGVSPRNLRRMRDFYRMYEGEHELLALAMEIGWTQNVVILEAVLSMEERRWYLGAVRQFGWTKVELQRNIESGIHLETRLDEPSIPCYTEYQNQKLECTEHDQDTFSQPGTLKEKHNGSVCAKRPCEESRSEAGISNRISSHQCRGGQKSNLFAKKSQTSPSAPEQRLRAVRPFDRYGLGRYAKYVPDLRRRLCGQNAPAGGFYRPLRGESRFTEYRRCGSDPAGCGGWMFGAVRLSYQRRYYQRLQSLVQPVRRESDRAKFAGLLLEHLVP